MAVFRYLCLKITHFIYIVLLSCKENYFASAFFFLNEPKDRRFNALRQLLEIYKILFWKKKITLICSKHSNIAVSFANHIRVNC